MLFWVLAAQSLWCSAVASSARIAGIWDGESGRVAVAESETHRVLLRDGVVLGAEYIAEWARPQAAFTGMALMQVVAFLQPRPERVLCLGLGAGTVPEFLRAQGIKSDVVELDKAVISASELFAISARLSPGQTWQADARVALGAAGAVYDIVLSDLFDGDNPLAFLTAEHFQRMRAALHPEKGIAAVNLVADREGQLAKAVARTLRSVFSHVLAVSDDALSAEPAVGNVFFIASQKPLRWQPPIDRGFPEESAQYAHSHFLEWQVPQLQAALEGSSGEILHDGVEPSWLAEEAAAIRGSITELQRALLPAEAWARLGFESGREM